METSLPALPRSEVNLRDYLDILRRRKAIMLQTFVVVVAVGFIVTALSRPIYEASAKMLVVASGPTVTFNSSENPLSNILIQAQPDSVATQVEQLQSEPELIGARKRAQPPRVGSPGDASIKVAVVEGTNVIRVTVQSPDPKYAANLADSILKEHNEQSKTRATEQLDKALAFVRLKLDEARKDLAYRELALSKFRTEHRIEDRQKEAERDRQASLDTEGKIRETETNLEMARGRLAELKSELAHEKQNVVSESFRPNPKYDRIADKLAAAEEQFEQVKEQYNESALPYKAAQAQVQSLQRQLDQTDKQLQDKSTHDNPLYGSLLTKVAETESDIRGLRMQQTQLLVRRSQLPKTDANTAAWEVDVVKYQRERDNAEKNWLDLVGRERDLSIRQQGFRPQNRPIETASVPGDPVRPKKATNIMLSIALAICLGLVMAFLQEYLDDRVNSPEDADRSAHLPMLGYVPAIPDREPTVVTNLPARSHVAEAYRTLRSSIGFAAVDGSLNTLMVTSASKGEGKTVTSLNLAIAMALDGKSVILVDADLRRPNVHKQLRMPQGPGLTDVLVGQAEIESVLNPTEVSGLRVMTAGPIPPNPAELLNSAPMDRVIEQLREMADVVIFDTAPCIPVSDSIVLSSKVDGVVLVVHAGETKKAALKHTREMLDRARARTLGIVFNKVPQRKGGYYYYYYYYYGGYYEQDQHEGGRGRGRRRRSSGGSGQPPASLPAESRSANATHDSDQEEAS